MKYLPFLVIFLFSCRRVKPETPNPISDIQSSSTEFIADGTTVDTLTALLNSKSDLTKANLVFASSEGDFIGGTGDTILSHGQPTSLGLLSKAMFKSPIIPTSVTFSVYPANSTQYIYNEYSKQMTISYSASLPDSIHLETSSYGLESNFQSEVVLKATLFNIYKNKVSLNTPVIWTDSALDGSGQKGAFRNQQQMTDSSSSVSSTFSIGRTVAGNRILITVQTDDSMATPRFPKDTIVLTITK